MEWSYMQDQLIRSYMVSHPHLGCCRWKTWLLANLASPARFPPGLRWTRLSNVFWMSWAAVAAAARRTSRQTWTHVSPGLGGQPDVTFIVLPAPGVRTRLKMTAGHFQLNSVW